LQAALPLATGDAARSDERKRQRTDLQIKDDEDLLARDDITVAEVESLLARLPPGDNEAARRQAALALRLCGAPLASALPDAAERTALAHKAWTALEEAPAGPSLGVDHYNSLLAVYLENGHAFSPEHMMSRLEKTGVKANKDTFRALLDRYCQQGDMDGASNMLKVSLSINGPLNVIHCHYSCKLCKKTNFSLRLCVSLLSTAMHTRSRNLMKETHESHSFHDSDSFHKFFIYSSFGCETVETS
jgi:hypothetical protein